MTHVLNSNGSLFQASERERLLELASADDTVWPVDLGPHRIDIDEHRNLWLCPHNERPILVGALRGEEPPPALEVGGSVALMSDARHRWFGTVVADYRDKLHRNLGNGSLITGADPRVPGLVAMIDAFDAFGVALDAFLTVLAEHEVPSVEVIPAAAEEPS